MASMADAGKRSGNRPSDRSQKAKARKIVSVSGEEIAKYLGFDSSPILASRLKQWFEAFQKGNRSRVFPYPLQDLLVHDFTNYLNDRRQLPSGMVPNKGAGKKTRRKQSKAA